jgi:hypothetical protein
VQLVQLALQGGDARPSLGHRPVLSAYSAVMSGSISSGAGPTCETDAMGQLPTRADAAKILAMPLPRARGAAVAFHPSCQRDVPSFQSLACAANMPSAGKSFLCCFRAGWVALGAGYDKSETSLP